MEENIRQKKSSAGNGADYAIDLVIRVSEMMEGASDDWDAHWVPLQYKDAILSLLAGMGNPMLKERRPEGRLCFNMALPILVRRCLYIETGRW